MEGNIKEASSGYTFFWKGNAPDEPRIHRVGLPIKSQPIQQHNFVSSAISERMILVRIPLIKDKSLALISVYAPTLTSDDETKAAFYNHLDLTIQADIACENALWWGILTP